MPHPVEPEPVEPEPVEPEPVEPEPVEPAPVEPEPEPVEAAAQRIERQAERELARYKDRVVIDFIEVLDDLERALAAADRKDALVDGVELTRARFLEKLSKHGVARHDDANVTFDPARHEAIGVMRVEDPELDGVVLDVVLAGYRRGDRVIRPASVIVGRLSA